MAQDCFKQCFPVCNAIDCGIMKCTIGAPFSLCSSVTIPTVLNTHVSIVYVGGPAVIADCSIYRCLGRGRNFSFLLKFINISSTNSPNKYPKYI